MIPLLQTQPLPEFVELLDDLKLPKTRSADYLVGVWILNRGKLVPPPAPLSNPVLVAQPHAMSPPAHQPFLPPMNPQNPGILPFPQIPPIVSMPGILPQQNPLLAAEVASLTPDQVQVLLRTLASSTQVTQAPSHSQPQGLPPFPPHISPQSAPATSQPWILHAPPSLAPYPINFPPQNVPFHQPHDPNTSPPGYDRQGPDRRDYDRPPGGYDRDYRPGPLHDHGDRDRGYRGNDRGDRGWRGHGRGRGGGRGRGRGGDGQYDREIRAHRDSGWPRRPRNEGQEGASW